MAKKPIQHIESMIRALVLPREATDASLISVQKEKVSEAWIIFLRDPEIKYYVLLYAIRDFCNVAGNAKQHGLVTIATALLDAVNRYFEAVAPH